MPRVGLGQGWDAPGPIGRRVARDEAAAGPTVPWWNQHGQWAPFADGLASLPRGGSSQSGRADGAQGSGLHASTEGPNSVLGTLNGINSELAQSEGKLDKRCGPRGAEGRVSPVPSAHSRLSHSEAKLRKTYGTEKVKLDRIIIDKEKSLDRSTDMVEQREVRGAWREFRRRPRSSSSSPLPVARVQAELAEADAVAARKSARADVAKARMQALRERFDNYVGALRTAEASFHAASQRHSANMVELQKTVTTFDEVMQALQGGPSVVRKTPVPRQHVGPRAPAVKAAQSTPAQVEDDERAIDAMVSEVAQLVAEREALQRPDLERAPRGAGPLQGEGTFNMPTGGTGATGATGASQGALEEELDGRFSAGANRVADVHRAHHSAVPSPEAEVEPALLALYQEVRAHARGERVYECPKGYCVRAVLALEEYGNTMECFNADVLESEATAPAHQITAEAGLKEHSSGTAAPLCAELLRTAESVEEQAPAKDMSSVEYGDELEKVVGTHSAAMLTGDDSDTKAFASHDDMLLYATRAVALAKAQMQDRSAEWHDSMLKLHEYRETVLPILQEMMHKYRSVHKVYVEEVRPVVEDAEAVVEARQQKVKEAEELQVQSERDLETAISTTHRINKMYETEMAAITGRKERVRDQLLLSSEAHHAFVDNTRGVKDMLAKYFDEEGDSELADEAALA